MDQSIQETGFIWSNPYCAKVTGFSEQENQFLIKAVHDGYSRLKESVWHKRGILFFEKGCFLIRDSFQGKGVHEFELNFHLHPNTDYNPQKSWWRIDTEGARIYMRLLGNDEFSPVSGKENPIHGWYSPHYGTKVKGEVLSCKKRGLPSETSFMTAICSKSIVGMSKIQEKIFDFG